MKFLHGLFTGVSTSNFCPWHLYFAVVSPGKNDRKTTGITWYQKRSSGPLFPHLQHTAILQYLLGGFLQRLGNFDFFGIFLTVIALY